MLIHLIPKWPPFKYSFVCKGFFFFFFGGGGGKRCIMGFVEEENEWFRGINTKTQRNSVNLNRTES